MGEAGRDVQVVLDLGRRGVQGGRYVGHVFRQGAAGHVGGHVQGGDRAAGPVPYLYRDRTQARLQLPVRQGLSVRFGEAQQGPAERRTTGRQPGA